MNLFNLIDHRRDPVGVEIKVFKSFATFRQYTVPHRIYPKNKAKKDGFIKALLRGVL